MTVYTLQIFEFEPSGRQSLTTNYSFTVRPYDLRRVTRTNMVSGSKHSKHRFTPSEKAQDMRLLTKLLKELLPFMEMARARQYWNGRADSEILWSLHPSYMDAEDFKRLQKMMVADAL